MTLAPTTELNTEGYALMCRDLQKIAPWASYGTILKTTMAQILNFCIRNTKAASRAKIIDRATERSQYYEFPSGQVIYHSRKYAGAWLFLDTSTHKDGRGRTAPHVSTDGKTWHDMSNFRWSADRWARYCAMIAETDAIDKQRGNAKKLQAALGSRGLAKHSWYQIAEAIGIEAEIKAAAWVKSAKPSNGKTYQNGTAKVAIETLAAYIEIFNTNPAAIGLAGQWVLNNGIAARVKAFERDVELGVFNDFKTRAERYPGIFVNN